MKQRNLITTILITMVLLFSQKTYLLAQTSETIKDYKGKVLEIIEEKEIEFPE